MILKNLTFEKYCDVGALHEELKSQGVTFSGVSRGSDVLIVHGVDDSQKGMVEGIVRVHSSLPKTDEELRNKAKNDFLLLSQEGKILKIAERLGLQ